MFHTPDRLLHLVLTRTLAESTLGLEHGSKDVGCVECSLTKYAKEISYKHGVSFCPDVVVWGYSCRNERRRRQKVGICHSPALESKRTLF